MIEKWRIESHDNYVRDGTLPIRIVDGDNNTVACNSEYYPTAITQEHAEIIVTSVNEFDDLRVTLANLRTAGIYDNTPTVAVVIAPTLTGGVLTVRRTSKDGHGQFALPGGWQERPESIEDAAVREFFEETGIFIESAKLRLVNLVTTPDGYTNLAFFELADKIDVSEAMPNAEVSEFSDTQAPTNLAFPLHTEALKAYFERTS